MKTFATKDMYSVIQSCRLCKKHDLHPIINFPNIPLANSYLQDARDIEFLFPLTVVQCENCGHVQLLETVKPELLFSNYAYSSSDSPSLCAHFKEYAASLVQEYGGHEYTQVVEIGCNDGILLREFAALGIYHLIGVDPANNLAEKAKSTGATIYTEFFNTKTAKKLLNEHGPANFICCNNTFAHIAELDEVVKGVKMLMHQDSVFVFENAYLGATISNLYFDQFYHEHLQYYALKPLVSYLAKHGLTVVDAQMTKTQGGSIRVFVQLANGRRHISPRVESTINLEEMVWKLYSPNTYTFFVQSLYDLKRAFTSFLENLGAATVSCYGCPAKFALFSDFFDLTPNNVQYVVDDSPLKQGLLSPGSNIPIVSQQYFKDNPTDYCIVSAWNMAEAIMKKNSDYKGRFVVPLPALKIYEPATKPI